MAERSLPCSKTLNPSHPAAAENTQIQQQTSTDQPCDVVSGEKRKRDDSDSGGADPSLDPLWKTSLCSYFRRQDSSCSHGSACRFAHGEEELRPRPDNTWDPTSERAKKAMKTDAGHKRSVSMGVMMTEFVGDDADADDKDGSNHALRKCLMHLPRKWTSENLRNFLNENGVPFKSAKKKIGMPVGFVTFEDQEQLKNSSKELDGKTTGNGRIEIEVADVIPRSFEKEKNSNVAVDGETNGGNVAVDGSMSKTRSLRDVVTPLAHMAYVDQLEHKKSSLMKILKKLTSNARKACPHGISLPEWILQSKCIGGLPCKLEGIIGSPIVNGYRNKCEFSVGYSLKGKITVGFMLGNFREGVAAVEEAVDCPNVSSIALQYASIFQEFLQHSNLPVWNRYKNSGFWRQLTVREGRTNEKVSNAENFGGIAEVMLIVQVSTVGFDDVLLTGEFEKLVQAFVTGATASSPSLPLTALVVQDHQGISNVAPADAPLRSLLIPKAVGEKMDVDNSAMDVNTLAAEKLYSLAGDWACLGPDTLLFDICCGTGTIGLTLAHRVGMVIGIEMNASAVSDAHRNAEINGIKNCRFICAKAENVMGSLLNEYLDVAKEQVNVPSSSGTSIEEVSEGRVSHGNEDGEPASQCSENENQQDPSEVQKGSDSKNGNSLVQQVKNVVAIVDPPRPGLHPTVIKALRTHPRLRRLVYISCNPESLVANAIELCTPSPSNIEKGKKNNRGWRNMSSAGLARHRTKSMPISEAFQPIKAIAVDLFPHTEHCELVMLLER
ncbi:zinc finger CCCH domain-containing protein 24 [Senna tora]|uniref:Zinc finger CCCH domain-containing protein 24 n=1 Tax=Senna tora TaxID=362788 RepID=A0A834W661_9FABA|nr:zinc finger CCCH domain-containing protein 24 [Senna tora]